jgi:CBS domain-containing protein
MQTVSQVIEGKPGPVFSVNPTTSVFKAIEVMATNHVGALLVMDDDALLGIISERDYARKVVLMNRTSHDTSVGDIMSSPPITVTPEDSVHHCMEVMTAQRIRHLPVVRGASVIGILSIGDIVKALMEEQSRHIEELERYIAG